MNGQTALRMGARHHKIAGLILCSPAIYAASSTALPFGPQFSENIRRPMSWKESGLEQGIRQYPGKVVLITPENDHVIPQGVFDIIESNVPPDKLKRMILEDAPHALGAWFNENPNRASEVINQSLDFITQGLGEVT
jgi:uncharacterized protein